MVILSLFYCTYACNLFSVTEADTEVIIDSTGVASDAILLEVDRAAEQIQSQDKQNFGENVLVRPRRRH